jgi:hypothetical protein
MAFLCCLACPATIIYLVNYPRLETAAQILVSNDLDWAIHPTLEACIHPIVQALKSSKVCFALRLSCLLRLGFRPWDAPSSTISPRGGCEGVYLVLRDECGGRHRTEITVASPSFGRKISVG